MASASDHRQRTRAEPEAEPVARKPSSTMAFIAAMLILTGFGVGFGGLSGLQLLGQDGGCHAREGRSRSGQSAGRLSRAAIPPTPTLRAAAAHRHQPRQPRATPGSGSRRRSSSNGEQTAEANVLAGAESPRTSSPSCAPSRSRRSKGASGFQHLREDLSDRVRVRSGGKIRDLVIQSMDDRMSKLLPPFVILLAGSAEAVAQMPSLESLVPSGDPTAAGRIVQLIAVVTILSVAPGLLIMVTCFTRFVVALSFLRAGLGLQTTPANLILISLALFMTFYVMGPTFDKAWQSGVQPLMEKKITEQEAYRASPRRSAPSCAPMCATRT